MPEQERSIERLLPTLHALTSSGIACWDAGACEDTYQIVLPSGAIRLYKRYDGVLVASMDNQVGITVSTTTKVPESLWEDAREYALNADSLAILLLAELRAQAEQ